jgi:hypothetical protein
VRKDSVENPRVDRRFNRPLGGRDKVAIGRGKGGGVVRESLLGAKEDRLSTRGQASGSAWSQGEGEREAPWAWGGTAAVGANQNVLGENESEKRGPIEIASTQVRCWSWDESLREKARERRCGFWEEADQRGLRSRGSRDLCFGLGAGFILGSLRRGDDVGPPIRIAREDPVVSDQVEARPGHEQREAAHHGLAGEDQTEGAVGQGVLESVGVAAVLEAGETRQREGRAGAIGAQVLEASAVVLVNVGAGLKRESLERCTRPPLPNLHGSHLPSTHSSRDYAYVRRYQSRTDLAGRIVELEPKR